MASKTKEVQFYQSGQAPVVWDKDTDRALARFTDGMFTTKDTKTIKLLMKLGYQIVQTASSEDDDDSGDADGQKPAVSRVKE